MSVLRDFLQRNQIVSKDALPLVHSTEAYHLKKLMKSGKIIPTPCNFFRGEQLSYFFVGRPAFKRSLPKEPEYWELPMCIIMDFRAFKPKRIFPFDSGAFKSGIYPKFISMMKLDDFEVANDASAAQKLIGTFFVSNRNYYVLHNRPRDEFESRFDVDVLNEEIKALHRLIEYKHDNIDDRRFSIEFQCDRDVVLCQHQVLAIVIPETYVESKEVVRYIETTLGATVITYPVYPLKKDYFYYAIYEKVDNFFRQKRYYNV